MKKILVFWAALGLLISFSLSSNSAELKIGYVDIFEIFNDYKKTKEYDAVLEKKKTDEEKKLDTKREEIEKMQGKLSLLKEKEKENEEAKVAQAKEEYLELREQIFMNLKEERDEKMKEIVEDINAVIADYAKNNGFDLIVNESAVLYGSKGLDITSEIMKLVNEESKKKESKKK